MTAGDHLTDYVQVDVSWVVDGTEKHSLWLRKATSEETFVRDAREMLDAADRRVAAAVGVEEESRRKRETRELRERVERSKSTQ